MRFSEAKKHDVVSTRAASKVARVEGFVVAADPARITTLRLGKVDGDADLLDWSALSAFGPDAVTIESTDALHTARDDNEQARVDKHRDVLGKPVLSEYGDGLGEVTDVDFDPETGHVRALLTKQGEVRGDRIIGLGTYAVIVTG